MSTREEVLLKRQLPERNFEKGHSMEECLQRNRVQVKPEKCFGCDQVKVYSGEFCDDCLEAWKEEGREVVY